MTHSGNTADEMCLLPLNFFYKIFQSDDGSEFYNKWLIFTNIINNSKLNISRIKCDLWLSASSDITLKYPFYRTNKLGNLKSEFDTQLHDYVMFFARHG